MKITKNICCLVLAACFFLTSCQYRDEVNAVKSISKITDGVFFLEYEGDYGFDEYLAEGGAKDTVELSNFITNQLYKGKWTATADDEKQMKPVKIGNMDFGCASISVKNAENPGSMIFGRNYDWKDCKVMIIHSKPVNGYESISTCCLSHITNDDTWEPTGSLFNNMTALAAIYVPMDGMNEKGLYIADLIAGDREETAQERGNVSMTTTDAIRLVLDRAANVDEAVSLLENCDMHSVIGYAHHLAIADSQGKAVAVEWVNNVMYVSETNVLTNHYVTESPKKDDGTDPETENSRTRFESLGKSLSDADCTMTADKVGETMKSVSAGQYGSKAMTVWSAVFEPANKKVSYYFREDYNKKFVFELQ